MLIEAGHFVVGVDNLNNAYDMRLKKWRLERLLGRTGFQFHQNDICDRPAMECLVEKARPDAVINLAARAGVRQSLENPWIYLETNVTGTVTLLEVARKYGIPKFVLASTSSLYGAHNPIPYSETTDTNCPLSPYAATKKGAEALCYSYHHLYGIDVSVLRYFTVFGPAGRPDMSMFRFVQWISESRPVTIYGDGEQSRDFTYVDDIARGTIKALKPLGYAVINLGSDKPASVNHVVQMIERLLGKRAMIERRKAHPADVVATWADITRARELLGWSPTVSLVEGVTRLVTWYRQNHTFAQDIDTRG
jgi:nucleoside-diphosphate-sugar epimerase